MGVHMKQVQWTVPIYEEYLRLTLLSDFQKQVMDLHVRRYTDYQIAMQLNTSESAVQRAIRECKKMYDAVQPYSSILPVRKRLKSEENVNE